MQKLLRHLCMLLALLVATPMQAQQAEQVFTTGDAQMCMAQAMFFEARGEPEDGKMAVAIVFETRAQQKMWGDTHVCQAIYRDQQASYANAWPEGTRARMALAEERVAAIIAEDSIEAVAYARALEMADAILENTPQVQAIREQLAGADHFLTRTAYLQSSSSHWAKIYRHVATFGGHQFHRS